MTDTTDITSLSQPEMTLGGGAACVPDADVPFMLAEVGYPYLFLFEIRRNGIHVGTLLAVDAPTALDCAEAVFPPTEESPVWDWQVHLYSEKHAKEIVYGPDDAGDVMSAEVLARGSLHFIQDGIKSAWIFHLDFPEEENCDADKRLETTGA